VQHDDNWMSAPEWDAPTMPTLPQWRFRTFDGKGYYALDWQDEFRCDLTTAGQPTAGAMRGFHVVFRMRVEHGGTLSFYDTDGSIIRRNGELVHEDREAHPPRQHQIEVLAGDRLEIAQWQRQGEWIWAARRETVQASLIETALALVAPFMGLVTKALANPNGPMLKVYTSAVSPLRCALSIYSMVLNGYRPAGVQIFGDYQWSPNTKCAMQALMPFAEIVPVERVESLLSELDPRLVPLARRTWSAMKICIGLFIPPNDYCFLDDDIFVLDRIDDAIRLHSTHRLVYAPDRDHEQRYRALWCPTRVAPLPTGNINTGFYFVKNRPDLKSQSERLLATSPNGQPAWLWEQGFFAYEFADERSAALPAQKYFYPFFDGLPGGLLGYDWRTNPCDFVTVHFGGPQRKPTDKESAALVRDILARCQAVV
jgi:hypothetical protein